MPGGSFTELYALDFRERFILMGHDGPFHLTIAEGRPVLRHAAWVFTTARQATGISVEASVRKGPITILGLTQTRDGRLKLVTAEGESLAGERLRIGNTNSRLRFALEPAPFMNAWCAEGPTHHCALGVGHLLGEIEKVAALLNIELSVIGNVAARNRC